MEIQPRNGGRIDLGIGRPDLALLPFKELREAAERYFSLGDVTCLQYAPLAGAPSLRESLADFLTRHYQSRVTPEHLFLTAGASHGLDLVSGQVAKPGGTVLVEAPTYFLAFKVFHSRNLRVVSVPTDSEGLDVVALENLLEVERPVFLYTIPTHHNPMGATLSIERRVKLIELANKYEFFIVADEVYQLLNYFGQAPPRLAAFDHNRVISLGSFSKILSPGVRLGWIETAPELFSKLGQCGVLQSGGGVSPFTSAMIESALALGLQDTYLERVRNVYGQRCAHMTQVLDSVLPSSVNFVHPTGGFFVWLELPESVDSNLLLAEAHDANIGFRPGTLFSPDREFKNFLRLCFAYYNEAELEWACEQLGRLLTRYL
ncbi:MAG: PLP-dependent aminotransferase family protein [Leptolyngbyaceae cyanobacterium MO_188.B28]|nr:PLP-dependent aminotransferase family protein [Leptolyngbyaceae cyanobacterium MO_188.B28]